MPQSKNHLERVVAILAQAAAEADEGNHFPATGIRAVYDAGLLETTVGKEFGGAGASLPDTAELLAELGRGDPSVALISAMTLYTHLGQAARKNWPRGLYESLLAQARQRPVLLNAARVEPELGSPARGGIPLTTARRTAHGWSITGRKRFVTGSAGLSHFLVWATTDEKAQRVGTFVVPAETPGINIIENWKSLGMRASGSHDVEFVNVEVPFEDVIDLVDAGSAGQDNRAHAGPTLALTAIYLGVAEAAQAAFSKFVHERVPANLGHAIARTERIINIAGEIDLRVAGARELIFHALRHGQDSPEKLTRARLLAGRQLKEAVQIAVSALGNPGLGEDLGLERHFRDIQSVLVHAPQEDTAIALLGRSALARRQKDEEPVESASIRKAG